MSSTHVDKELLEKYHLGFCTAEEKQRVEKWLFSAETDDLMLSKPEAKFHRDEMWVNIKTIMDTGNPAKTKKYFMWKGAIAASIVFVILSLGMYFLFIRSVSIAPESFSYHNSMQAGVKHVAAEEYNISIGPQTNAQIHTGGVIDLSGSILISPKEDISLTFKGTQKKVTLKKGQTYIILNSEIGAKGIIVVNDRNLLDLPPIMQKQISSQFGI
ncbi:hypothetical protein [Pedobacter agri]|uniref:hypothetical protein n=1 Tax=Pedobacter agri TaxID=454586 RepID=UPI00292D0C1B|nr:hypothetical protein [Pedobacter agri]